MSTIMVQVTDHAQTLAALHLACALARSNQQRIVLLKLIPAPYPGWLGTEWGYMNFTDKDQQALKGYEKVVESYGIDVTTCPMQVVSSLEGIIYAANSVDAQIVFARLSHSLIPFWHAWQTRILQRSLEKHQRQLYTLEYQDTPPGWKLSSPISAIDSVRS